MDGRHNLFVSSDVESGWTVYLENSSSCLFSGRIIEDSFDVQKDEDEELDLSMVSDASSGPRIFRENEVVLLENETGRCFCDTTAAGRLPKGGRKTKGGDDQRRRCDRPEQTASLLDDTASSDPNFNNSESSTSCQNQLNTVRQSSLSGNQRQKNQWFKGKRSGLT